MLSGRACTASQLRLEGVKLLNVSRPSPAASARSLVKQAQNCISAAPRARLCKVLLAMCTVSSRLAEIRRERALSLTDKRLRELCWKERRRLLRNPIRKGAVDMSVTGDSGEIVRSTSSSRATFSLTPHFARLGDFPARFALSRCSF